MTTPHREERFFERDGQRIRGVAISGGAAAPLPAVIVLPDVHGVSDLYLRIGERLAADGFLAFVLDLYSREGTPALADLDAVFAWIAELDDRQVLGDVAGATGYLKSLPEVDRGRVGIVGFCLGGQYALLSACTIPDLGVAVSFYGMLRYHEHNERKPAGPLDVVDRLGCPYLGLFGAEDALIPLEDVRALQERLARLSVAHDVHVYPGAGHAFCNDSRPDAYRAEAAGDAFRRASAFLRRHLAAA